MLSIWHYYWFLNKYLNSVYSVNQLKSHLQPQGYLQPLLCYLLKMILHFSPQPRASLAPSNSAVLFADYFVGMVAKPTVPYFQLVRLFPSPFLLSSSLSCYFLCPQISALMFSEKTEAVRRELLWLSCLAASTFQHLYPWPPPFFPFTVDEVFMFLSMVGASTGAMGPSLHPFKQSGSFAYLPLLLHLSSVVPTPSFPSSKHAELSSFSVLLYSRTP